MKKYNWKIGWIGMMIFMILFSSFSPLFFQKNKSQRIISKLQSKGWWEEKLPNTTLSFSTKNLHLLEWEEENEFVYQGEFYDVLDQIDSCGVVIFKVYHDSNDTKWFAMKEIYKKQSSKKINKNSSTTFYLSTLNPFNIPFFEPIQKKEVPLYQYFIQLGSTQTPSPPPKI
jgi:hypothetical protein